MIPSPQQDLLRRLPAITDLLALPETRAWLEQHPRTLVTECLRQAVEGLRRQILADAAGRCGAAHTTPEAVAARARRLLEERLQPRLCEALNATGVILHTGLGRAVYPERVVDSLVAEMKGCTVLAVDRDSGERVERDELVEGLLSELTGAEAATVVNNNAAATLLVLAALAAPGEVLVSRGQLIEIGGSFRLPDVMAQSGARLVEVGTTNRTHLRDYQKALTEKTTAILKVHPSNYRVTGFTCQPAPEDLAALAHSKGVLYLDDLGAGALLDLAQFGLPSEPTARQSIESGADVVFFSGDKLPGAAQSGIIAGRKSCIEKIRRHPLMRALRVDKTCLMILERTLALFRDPDLLRREHPVYRMMTEPLDTLKSRAQLLARAIQKAAPAALLDLQPAQAFLGSGSLPEESLPSVVVRATLPPLSAAGLARQLRLDPACVFARVESDRVCLDLRTLPERHFPAVAAAFGRIGAAAAPAA